MSHEIDEVQIQALVKMAKKCLLPLAPLARASGFRLFIRLPDGRDFEVHFPDSCEVVTN